MINLWEATEVIYAVWSVFYYVLMHYLSEKSENRNCDSSHYVSHFLVFVIRSWCSFRLLQSRPFACKTLALHFFVLVDCKSTAYLLFCWHRCCCCPFIIRPLRCRRPCCRRPRCRRPRCFCHPRAVSHCLSSRARCFINIRIDSSAIHLLFTSSFFFSLS